ncbi:energy-coupling factor transporter transmembrane component T family protein [Atopobium fossor]|uniref:energy-coupling factor transporter transmembrane component T family protein n=1 Tax=Atopobium fossor TaxID=39487 RepID=UPI000418C4C5|nr:energy-coupling factor transporter transmembrane component T [Atopobium fossor]
MKYPCTCLDPRTVLFSVCLLGITAIISNQPEAAHVACTIGVFCALAAGAWRPCIVLSAVYVIIAVGMALVEKIGSTSLVVAVVMLSYIAQKFVVLALLGVSLSMAASMQSLLTALQVMGAPQSILIPCMVILRFFPTIRKDASQLIESLKTRRVLEGRGYMLSHPILVCEFLIVPLLMRSMRVSDELAASALARGLGSNKQPTVLHPLSFGTKDAVAAVLALLAAGMLMWLQFGPR